MSDLPVIIMHSDGLMTSTFMANGVPMATLDFRVPGQQFGPDSEDARVVFPLPICAIEMLRDSLDETAKELASMVDAIARGDAPTTEERK